MLKNYRFIDATIGITFCSAIGGLSNPSNPGVPVYCKITNAYTISLVNWNTMSSQVTIYL